MTRSSNLHTRRSSEESKIARSITQLGENLMEWMGHSEIQGAPEGNTRHRPVAGTSDEMANLNEFQKLRPWIFASSIDPLEADDWLSDTEMKLIVASCDDKQKVFYASQLLFGAANAWWTGFQYSWPLELPITWEIFKEKFRKDHVYSLAPVIGPCHWPLSDLNSDILLTRLFEVFASSLCWAQHCYFFFPLLVARASNLHTRRSTEESKIARSITQLGENLMEWMGHSEIEGTPEGNARHRPLAATSDEMANLKEFQKLRPWVFASSIDPLEADDWLSDTETKLTIAGCDDEQKVLYASRLLFGAANAWWTSFQYCWPLELPITWEIFKEKFREDHVSAGVMIMR